MGRAEIYAHTFYECNSSSSDDEGNNGVFDLKRSHRPDKPAKLLPTVKKKRSLDSQAFKNALEKSKQKSIYTKIIKIVKTLDSLRRYHLNNKQKSSKLTLIQKSSAHARLASAQTEKSVHISFGYTLIFFIWMNPIRP